MIIFADTGLDAAGRMTRCSMGFFVSIVWIMAIADEVVNVLQVNFILVLFFDHFCVAELSEQDIWFHLWTLGCHHWSYHLCCWQLSCRPCCKYECCSTLMSTLEIETLNNLCSLGIRTYHGILSLFRGSHAEHPSRRWSIGLVSHSPIFSALFPSIINHAIRQLFRIAFSSRCYLDFRSI